MNSEAWLGLACAALYLAMGLVLRPVAGDALRLQFTFSARAFQRICRPWSRAQRRRYALHFPLDYAFLLLYAWLGHRIAVDWTSASGTTGSAAATLAPIIAPLAATADAVENLLQQRLLRGAPDRAGSDACAFAAGMAAALKWALFAVFAVWLATA